jgi:hypothetical protein
MKTPLRMEPVKNTLSWARPAVRTPVTPNTANRQKLDLRYIDICSHHELYLCW